MNSLQLSPPKTAIALLLGAAASMSAILLIPAEIQLVSIVLAFALAWAALIDLDRLALPDLITLPLVGVGLVVASTSGLSVLVGHAVAAAIGYGSLTLIARFYLHVRNRSGLGQGDAKLFAAGGAWVGLAALPATMLVGATSAMVWIIASWLVQRPVARDTPIAFGPFLALGIWASWIMSFRY